MALLFCEALAHISLEINLLAHPQIMKRKIVGFHKDEFDDWVADLECSHTQHVRHKPPWQNRPWVVDPEERKKYIGHELDCKKCDEEVGTN